MFLYLFIYGVALEVMQWMTKYRYLDHWDVLANGIGLVAYLAVRTAINNIAILQQLHSAGDNQ
ncbi:MAG TPA: hypothetical protein DCM54_11420 [Gammaproteobacteria bacterium]|nr:hypothetical protein [Gammaproteobacteria bacterium]